MDLAMEFQRQNSGSRPQRVIRVFVTKKDNGSGYWIPSTVEWDHGESCKLDSVTQITRITNGDSEVWVTRYAVTILDRKFYLYQETRYDHNENWYIALA